MKENLSPPVVGGIIAVVVALVIGLGWFFMNRGGGAATNVKEPTVMGAGKKGGATPAGVAPD